MTEEIKEEEDVPLKVEITNPSKEEIIDKTQWDTEDEWDIINMSEEDIKQAEESRNA